MERCCEQEPKSTLASGIDFEMSVDVRNVRHDSLPIWSLGGYHLVHVLLTAQIFHIIDACVCVRVCAGIYKLQWHIIWHHGEQAQRKFYFRATNSTLTK